MEKRKYDRVHLTIKVQREDDYVRVRDISSHGLQIEVAPNTKICSQWAFELHGDAHKKRGLFFPKWIKHFEDKVHIGCASETDLSEFIAHEKEAQRDVSLLERDLSNAAHFMQTTLKGFKLFESEKKAIERYNKVGERDEFLWPWLAATFAQLEIHPRSPETRYAQLLLAMLVVLLDDIADNGADFKTTKLACDFACNNIDFSDELEPYRQEVIYAREVFEEIESIVSKAPQAELFWPIINYDIQQMRNNLIFSALSNSMETFNNATENEVMQHHSMVMKPLVMIELAFQKGVPKELDVIRELLQVASKMGRIGNTVSTWGRELSSSDFSSIFFVYLARQSKQSFKDLSEMPLEEVLSLSKASKVEEKLLATWLEHRISARRLANDIDAFDAHKYVDGLERLLRLQLGATGKK